MADAGEVLETMGRDFYAELTGLEVVRAEPGYAEVRMEAARKVVNGHGNVHGGALYTLADYAAALASNLHGAPTIGVDGSISYLRPVRAGHVVAKARTVKSGRRMNFQAVELFDADGELVAIFQGASIAVNRNGSDPAEHQPVAAQG